MKLLKLERKGCSPCMLVGNYLDSNGVEYEKVDVEDQPNIAVLYNVLSVPVTILLDDNGNVVKESKGFKPPELDELIAQLNQ